MTAITDPLAGGKLYTVYVADDNSVVRVSSLYLGDPQTNTPFYAEFRVAEQIAQIKALLGIAN